MRFLILLSVLLSFSSFALSELSDAELRRRLKAAIKKELQNQLNLIEEDKTTPFAAAEILLNLKK